MTVVIASESEKVALTPTPLAKRWLKSSDTSHPLVCRCPKFPLGEDVPSVTGSSFPGTIMSFVSRLNQSNVTPSLLSKKRKSTPRSSVSMRCQVIFLSINAGVPNKGMRLLLPSSHVLVALAITARYKVLGTDWSPMLPHDALNLPKLTTLVMLCARGSLVNTHPAEKEGNVRQRKCLGNFDEPSRLTLASSK